VTREPTDLTDYEVRPINLGEELAILWEQRFASSKAFNVWFLPFLPAYKSIFKVDYLLG